VGVQLTVLPEHSCAYLPPRVAQTRAFWCEGMDGEVYHAFMNAGFRRSGKLIYQPICTGCRACMPVRVAIDRFHASKSQRRCARRNQDLLVSAGNPRPTDEKFELYRRYVTQWHGNSVDTRETFEEFLYNSPVQTLEFTYRSLAGELLAVGICDVCRISLSSVYFYFAPESADKGLGTFGGLYEIEVARKLGIRYYYLGYWVSGCRSMQYKTTFAPCELLHADGVWRPGSAERLEVAMPNVDP
jgi:arginine-tRNA-protein transferase